MRAWEGEARAVQGAGDRGTNWDGSSKVPTGSTVSTVPGGSFS